jgi:glycosyltransferase involved in cell wall biosynthesis
MGLSFSIVIPNYNSGAVIERAVTSLLSQGYPHVQLIVADGGSSDVSREIIEQYREHFDVVICERDDGQADGLNKGFAQAHGAIFGWLCADDELLPGALDHVAGLFENRPEVDLVTGSCERVFEDGSTCITHPYPDAWERIGVHNVIEQPSTFWRAELHRKVGPLDTGYFLGFDWDFWARMRDVKANLALTDRVLSRYYFSDSNKCGTAGDLFAKEAFQLIKKHGPARGWVAYIYRFIYRHFDLHGCFDNPPTCSDARYFFYKWTRRALGLALGRRKLNMYNWHFASCQERGIKWY